jgi:hypothetical protein
MRGILFLALALFLGIPAYALDDDAPVANSTAVDGTVKLTGGSVALGVGYTWGRGELVTAGHSVGFAIKGVSVVDVGASDFDATGEVFNLKKLADFSGTYAAAGAGVAVVNGVTAVYLRNEHGVVIKLIASTTGLRFNLSADGVRVTLKN